MGNATNPRKLLTEKTEDKTMRTVNLESTEIAELIAVVRRDIVIRKAAKNESSFELGCLEKALKKLEKAWED